MAADWDARLALRALVADELGTIRKDAPLPIALVYPSPYRTAMSSLGYQTIYRRLNDTDGVCADRAMLPDDVAGHREARIPLYTLERERPVGEYPILAFSVAYELELGGVIDCLELSGLSALAEDRPDQAPLVVGAGPLSFSNPVPLAPFVDVIAMGEGENLTDELIATFRACGGDKLAVMEALAGRPGWYVPSTDGDVMPAVAKADVSALPARSQIITPHTELSSMFLTEVVRGCSRGCTYCVMRRSTNDGMRLIEPELVLEGIPEHATRVGLVGASVTDHPRIRDIVRGVVDSGRGVGISSLRADKLDDELVGLLAKGGYRTLTVASDGASERMRRVVERSTTEKHLVRNAELAHKHGIKTLKIYIMVGVPGETDDDIEELIRFTLELSRIHPRIALGVAPFVAKRNTPLDGTDFAGIKLVERRLERLRKGLRGKAKVRPVSARWSWVEYMLAQGDRRAGLALLDAHKAGGSFADYKRAFKQHGAEPTGPLRRVPSTSEVIAARRLTRKRG